MISNVAFGAGMICIGILIIIIQIKWYKKKIKDPFGYELRLLICGFGLVILGIYILIKYLWKV